MFKELILFTFIAFIVAAGFAEMSLDEAYKYGTNVAQSNKQKAMDGVQNFNPAEIFENYNANPSQTNYYQGVKQEDTQELKNRANILLSQTSEDQVDSLGAVKIAMESYRKLPKLEIRVDDPNNPWMSKASNIMRNADSIVRGISNSEKGVDCKQTKICHVQYSKKTCNEEVRAIHKICEKIPKVNISIKDVIYPNCQNLIVLSTPAISDPSSVSCPAGYTNLSYFHRAVPGRWNVITLCAKQNTEVQECFAGGYYTYSCGDMRAVDAGRATVPKKTHSRIKVSQLEMINTHVLVTIINETTGETICSNRSFGEGSVLELPFSEMKDQTFRFYSNNNGVCSWAGASNLITLYFDRVYKDRVANISWEETCHDV